MTLTWKREDTNKLIILLKQHECLWNIKSSTYQDRTMRRNAFESVLNEMKSNFRYINISDIKTKILSLRSQYRKELRAINESRRNGGEHIRYPRLWCFNQLDFLCLSLYKRESTFEIPELKTQNKENDTLSNSLSYQEVDNETSENNEEDEEIFSEPSTSSTVSRIQLKRAKINNTEKADSTHTQMVEKPTQRKYEWLGEQIVSTLNEMQNQDVIDEAIMVIQKEIMNFKIKDRSFDQRPGEVQVEYVKIEQI